MGNLKAESCSQCKEKRCQEPFFDFLGFIVKLIPGGYTWVIERMAAHFEFINLSQNKEEP
jgi:hypothetical protein